MRISESGTHRCVTAHIDIITVAWGTRVVETSGSAGIIGCRHYNRNTWVGRGTEARAEKGAHASDLGRYGTRASVFSCKRKELPGANPTEHNFLFKLKSGRPCPVACRV